MFIDVIICDCITEQFIFSKFGSDSVATHGCNTRAGIDRYSVDQ
jgi:hypothetical protein